MTKQEMTLKLAKEIALLGIKYETALTNEEADKNHFEMLVNKIKGIKIAASSLNIDVEKKLMPLTRYFHTLLPEEVENFSIEDLKLLKH